MRRFLSPARGGRARVAMLVVVSASAWACSAANGHYGPLDGDGDGDGGGSGSAAPTGGLGGSATSGGAIDGGGEGSSTTMASPNTSTGPASDESGQCVPVPWYLDDDGDGWGDPEDEIWACSPPGEDYVPMGGDCDDGEPEINPGQVELCNEVDDDCDELVDEGSPFNLLCDGCAFVSAADGLRWFAICEELSTWPDATSTCQDRLGPQAALAIIEDPLDQAALLALVLVDHWIGMSDLLRDEVWRWHDGTVNRDHETQLGFDGWGLSQPDPTPGEHCVELDPAQLGWADSACDQPQPIICEHPA